MGGCSKAVHLRQHLFDLVPRKITKNVVPDALSRIHLKNHNEISNIAVLNPYNVDIDV